MLLIISDASVLIDIECGALTNAIFNLPFQFAVPDILFEEELAEHHFHLLQLGLIKKIMDGDLIAKAYTLRQKYTKTSVNDLLALALAEHENCKLLTSDKALREAAKDLSVDVHGTIWLVETMLNAKEISIEVAHRAFQQMKNLGSRLPWKEVENLINRFQLKDNTKVELFNFC